MLHALAPGGGTMSIHVLDSESNEHRVALGSIEPARQAVEMSTDVVLRSRPAVRAVLQGTIHNHAELSETVSGGSLAPTAADLIARGYQERGIDFFRQLNGEFAFLLYDSRERRLYAVRDRFGTQLLFCCVAGTVLAIASEIKALFACGLAARPDWDTVRLYAFAHYRYAYGLERTFFDGIRLLPPNAICSWSLEHRDERRETLWPFEVEEQTAISDDEAVEQFHARLDKSFRRRFDSLLRPAAFLVSGGLDSPTIAALASRRAAQPVRAFSICYGDRHAAPGELQYDERPFIEPTVAQHGMEWSAIYPTADRFEQLFDAMLCRHDEPISSPTWYAHYVLIQQIAGEGYSVVFGGDGGDHALAGLYDDAPYYFADLKARGDCPRLDDELDWWERLHTHPVFPKNRAVWRTYCEKCFDWNRPGRIVGYVWDEQRMRALRPYETARHPAQAQTPIVPPLFPSVSHRYVISKLWQDLVYSSSPPSTRAEDINLATFGVSLQSVFLDADFMTFCWSLPGHLMVRNGLMKFLMRRAMTGLLPEPVRLKKEHVGLNAPANLWFRGRLRPAVEAAVRSHAWSEVELFDRVELERFLAEHMTSAADHMMFLWRVLSLEHWLRRWRFAV